MFNMYEYLVNELTVDEISDLCYELGYYDYAVYDTFYNFDNMVGVSGALEVVEQLEGVNTDTWFTWGFNGYIVFLNDIQRKNILNERLADICYWEYDTASNKDKTNFINVVNDTTDLSRKQLVIAVINSYKN